MICVPLGLRITSNRKCEAGSHHETFTLLTHKHYQITIHSKVQITGSIQSHAVFPFRSPPIPCQSHPHPNSCSTLLIGPNPCHSPLPPKQTPNRTSTASFAHHRITWQRSSKTHNRKSGEQISISKEAKRARPLAHR